jgi:hypothetical protein
MSKNVIIVVGDRFANFSSNPEVFCLSDFLAASRSAHATSRWLCPGQGISQHHRDIIRARFQARLPECQVTAPQSASRKATHKLVPHNIMISVPRRRDAETFEADLLLDDRSADISDHQTGQHIQGIALTEAARQTWTAVSETYLLPPGHQQQFVLDEISARFLTFVFPLPARLTLRLLEFQSTPIQSVCSVSVLVEQAGRIAAEIRGKFRTIDERISARMEAVAARNAITGFLASMERQDDETITHL